MFILDLYLCTLICYQFVSNIFVELHSIHQKKIARLVGILVKLIFPVPFDWCNKLKRNNFYHFIDK